MSIRKIIHYFKIVTIIVGLCTAVVKGYQYLPSLKEVDIKKTDVKIKNTKPHETEFLKEFFPEDKINRKEQILFRKSYVISYNRETKCPNWVLWELTREDMEVPSPRAELVDYRGSGYDRGHMCPAGDNKWDEDAMYESFLMTNMCPQNQQLNSGLWNQIEMQCRYWAKKYGKLYIVCGPIYLRGEYQTIGPNRVMVPEAFFKAVICLDGETKGIAFVCRNTKGDRKKDYYVNTIRQVERRGDCRTSQRLCRHR